MTEMAELDRIAFGASPVNSLDLGAGQKLKQSGKGYVGLPPTLVRELTQADLPALLEESEYQCEAYGGGMGLRKIKTSHHLLAMVIAGGAGNERASFITGYSPQTVAQLKLSPMFRELVAYYASQKEEEFKDFHRKAAAIGMDALDVLHERILTNPDNIKFDDLRKLAETLMDRTVLPSKVAKAPGDGVPSPAPLTVIQFIDSPNANAPAVVDHRVIEGSARELR